MGIECKECLGSICYRDTGIKSIPVWENTVKQVSYYICSHCGYEHQVFMQYHERHHHSKVENPYALIGKLEIIKNE